MKKRKLLIIGTLITCLLTGCCMSHDWKEATCSNPKTCTKCGEVEGEALGHTWVEATCSEPKHCSICGETEGETLAHTWEEATCAEPKHCSLCGETEGDPLEHTLTEANYQQPATCEVCGETVGEPLQAYFEKYGLEYNAELDKEYSFITPCRDNEDYLTEGKVTFSDYKVFESDETHEALDGYEWRTITVTVIFDDDNAYNYGYNLNTNLYDYYDEAYNDTENTYNENTGNYSLNYNGEDYDIEDNIDILKQEWDGHIATVQIRYSTRLPKGYDGGIVALFSSTDWDMVKDMPDNTLYFRLK